MRMWEKGHPLTIERLAYVTVGVKKLDEACRVYIDLMQAVPVHSGLDDTEQCSYQILQIGDCLLRLAEPVNENSALGEHVAHYGNMIYSITFRSRDLDSAESWLNSHAIRTERPRADILAANPEDTYGAPYFFTSAAIPNDPFGR